MKLDRNSNGYTVGYAIILCSLVAILLTAAAKGLEAKQNANLDNEKKQQILSAVSPALGKSITLDNAGQIWSELDMENNMYCVTTSGEKIEENPFKITNKSLFAGGVVRSDAKLPVYQTNVEGKSYYIMCMYGSGLWAPIWGYIAVEADGSTIAGVSFDHESETAGLGAKIKDDPSFAEAFIGKHIFKGGELAPVQVLKPGKKAANGADQVDGITGATKTSDYVGDMIRESMKGYQAFLQGVAAGNVTASAAEACEAKTDDACCADSTNVKSVNE